jgi:hypothetical protein
MYFSTFPSSEYYSDEDNENNSKFNENDVCIICWLPSDEKNKIIKLNYITTITTPCKCKPKIHELCFNDWIERSQSCPICRKNIIIHIQYFTNNSVQTFTCFFLIFNFATRLMRLATIISMLNIVIICSYNLYMMYYIQTEYFEGY